MTKIKTKSRRPSHVRSFRQPTFVNSNVSNIALGAAAGCAIGAAAALFFTPKQTRNKFAQELETIYDKVTGAAEYAHDALEKGQKVYKAARNSVGNIGAAATHVFSKRKSSNRNLILGVVGAGLLGVSAMYALSQRNDHPSFGERWKTSKWSDMAKLVVDSVSEQLHTDGSSHSHNGHHPVQNVLDWAVMGLNLWQEIQKRR